MRVEALEQSVNCAGLGELFAIKPDRLGVGDGVVKFEPEKAHEGEAVTDLKLRRVVAQRVERLQDQNLEHQHGVIRRAPALRAVRTLQRGGERRAKDLEIDQLFETRQRIASFRQLPIALVQIKKTRLPTHRHPLRDAATSESRPRPNREVFRGVQADGGHDESGARFL